MNKECKLNGCKQPARSLGLCGMHYARLRRCGNIGPDSRLRGEFKDKTCKVDSCNKPEQALGYCSMHYTRIRQNGEIGSANSLKRANGSGNISPEGYQYVYIPDHPNAYKNGKVAMHAMIMSEILGRPLREGESVHHKNGIKHDNSPDNLELRTSLHPSGQSIKEMVEFCKMYLSLYECEAQILEDND